MHATIKPTKGSLSLQTIKVKKIIIAKMLIKLKTIETVEGLNVLDNLYKGLSA